MSRARVLAHLEREGQIPSVVLVLAPDEDTLAEWLDDDRYGVAERGFALVATYRLTLREGQAQLPTGLWETAANVYLP